jgi:hypothetical protein
MEMATSSRALDRQLTPLTPEEEERLARVRARLEIYFRDIEELEGFTVLSLHFDRLLRKVVLELRCVCYEYHDSFLLLEALRAENESLREEMQRQEVLCDQVIAEAEATKARVQEVQFDHEQAIEKLHRFYATQDTLRRKQWAIEADTRHQHEIAAIAKENQAKLEQLSREYADRLETARYQIESKKAAELEFMEAQLRLQITSHVSRDLGKKLVRQEKLCAKHKHGMKHLQRRILTLQDAVKATTSRKELTGRR